MAIHTDTIIVPQQTQLVHISAASFSVSGTKRYTKGIRLGGNYCGRVHVVQIHVDVFFFTLQPLVRVYIEGHSTGTCNPGHCNDTTWIVHYCNDFFLFPTDVNLLVS